MLWRFSGVDISARYFLINAAHSWVVVACCADFMVSTLGARFGNQTSYQFRVAYSVLGTPRGGRRTVPMRVPSPSALALPSLTTRTTTVASDSHDARRASLPGRPKLPRASTEAICRAKRPDSEPARGSLECPSPDGSSVISRYHRAWIRAPGKTSYGEAQPSMVRTRES